MGKLPIKTTSRIAHKIAQIFRGDDFNWNLYPEHFALEMKDSSSLWVHHFMDYEIQDQLIKPKGTDKPLHPNLQVLYQAFIELHPATVLAVGCGWGYQLVMARRLAGAEPAGIDISEDQIAKALSDWPELAGKLKVGDVTRSFITKAEFVYSQAVLMHLSDSRARDGLRNMIKGSTGWVLLIENWERRDYLSILSSIGDFNWSWFERGGAKGLLIRIGQGHSE